MEGAGDGCLRPLSELLSLSGRTAVVTGGARGIGFAIARRLAEAGALVVIADRDAVAAKSAATALGADVAVTHRHLDVTDAASVRATAAAVSAEHGALDIWINNAGIFPSTPLLDLSDDEWDAVISVNLRGMFLGGREAGRVMRDTGTGGVIVNIASTSAHAGFGPGFAHYTSGKHGLLGLTKALAIELGPFGVRVVAVSPQLTPTEGIAETMAEFGASGMQETLDALATRTPLGRSGEPDDVAKAVVFAASDLAGFITGSNISVDGGLLAVG
jgi:NAD(P)-dependent dehydrogenase (short-subunit alcohol dehydrogenase family)